MCLAHCPILVSLRYGCGIRAKPKQTHGDLVRKMSDNMESTIFSGDNPFEIAKRWFGEAKLSEINDHDAVAMASVDATGMPNVRMVLLRLIDEDSFVFFSNYGSDKGQELLQSGKVAFTAHWKSLRRQVLVRGHVEKDDGPVADEYFKQRGRSSKIGAWASFQSQPLADRQELIDRCKAFELKYPAEVPRPDFWGGLRIRPVSIEFWSDRDSRLHDRFRWRKNDDHTWTSQRMSP